MSRPTPQDFITWANALVQFPWPIQLNDFAPYAEQLGWKPTPLPDEFSVCDDSDVEDVTLGGLFIGVFWLSPTNALSEGDVRAACPI